MLVTRTAADGTPRTFDVVDDPATRSWGYWSGHFATRQWEPETLDVVDRYADPGRRFVDIGAWVGPVTLWALGRYRAVTAIEPDPTARAVLLDNVARNAHSNTRVTVVDVAVASRPGVVDLVRSGEWGDSMSSTRTHARTAGPRSVHRVDTRPLWDILDGAEPPALVKLDVEGAEADILPSHAGYLRALGAPLLVSLHLPWLPAPHATQEAMATIGDVTRVGGIDTFPSYLVTPPRT